VGPPALPAQHPPRRQGTGQVRVRAHTRTDGTYVRAHYRSVDPAPTSSGSDWDWLGYLAAALFVLAILAAISQA
jgi:hypothetical protein